MQSDEKYDETWTEEKIKKFYGDRILATVKERLVERTLTFENQKEVSEILDQTLLERRQAWEARAERIMRTKVNANPKAGYLTLQGVQALYGSDVVCRTDEVLEDNGWDFMDDEKLMEAVGQALRENDAHWYDDTMRIMNTPLDSATAA